MSYLDKVGELLELNAKLVDHNSLLTTEIKALMRSLSHKDGALQKIGSITGQTHQGQVRCFTALGRIDTIVREGLRE